MTAPGELLRAVASRAGALLVLTVPALATAVEVGGSVPGDRAATFARPASPPAPADNEITPARVELGKALFFDPRLSSSGIQSCATCHNPSLSWSDGLPRAVGAGMQVLERRTPTLLDVAWSSTLFWDGRSDTLEAQALGPIQAPGEMNLALPELEARVGAIPGYGPLFAEAYPGEPISSDTIGRAIASFERTLVSGTSRFDRWVAGEATALTPAERRGFQLFEGKAGCGGCHTGWRFTDDGFYDVGLAGDDPGRAGVVVGVPEVDHAFKTPTLRDVARRPPYMHDGSAASLDEVVRFYDRGGDATRPSKAAQVRPLGLTPEERADLVAFLRALTGEAALPSLPTLPR